jgi:hypothetical protein
LLCVDRLRKIHFQVVISTAATNALRNAAA